MKRLLFLIFIAIIIVVSCTKKPYNYYPVEPQIYYKSVTPNVVNLNDTGNTIVAIAFSFNDGDGDLGYDPQDTVHNIYLKDSRDTSAADTTFGYPFPYVSADMRPKNGSLQGNVNINLTRAYFSLDSLHLALRGDTLTYKIYIKDKAGHKSNVITTDPIYLEF